MAWNNIFRCKDGRNITRIPDFTTFELIDDYKQIL